jgi:hypothetical protein
MPPAFVPRPSSLTPIHTTPTPSPVSQPTTIQAPVSSVPATPTPSPLSKPTVEIPAPIPVVPKPIPAPVSTPITPTVPAGCTSSLGYSATTGQSCAGSSSGQTASSLQVVSPNGGETFALGQQIAVSWTSTGYSNTATLDVYLAQKDDLDGGYATVAPLGKAVVSAKQGTFTIPVNVPAGNKYVIEIAAMPNITFDIDQSDSTFTITASVTAGLPAGCTSSTGYSSTTGVPCSGGSNATYSNGIQVTSTAQGTAVASTIGGSQTHNTFGFTIPFSVTAFGQNAYIPSFPTPATSASADRAIQFCVDTAAGACQAVGSGVLTYAGNDNLTIDNNGNYLIPAGQTKNFTLQITYTANGAASYRASLLSVNWNNTDSSYLFNIFTAGLNTNTFRTNYVSGRSIFHSTSQSGCNGTKYSATTGQLCVYTQ